MAQGSPHGRPLGHERIDFRRLENARRHRFRKQSLGLEHGQVDDFPADRRPDVAVAATDREHAEGQVLDREVGGGIVGTLDPASGLRVVGMIEIAHRVPVASYSPFQTGRSGSKWFLSGFQTSG